MALGDSLSPATNMFGSAFGTIASYAWVLIPLILVISVGLIAFVVHKIKQKNKQWTHTLKVRRVLDDSGRLSEVTIHKMRRFPLIVRSEVFELETPLIGNYLISELKQYSGLNEFSIILDRNNRIYLDEGSFFNPDSTHALVSAKHAEIDIMRGSMRENWQKMNPIAKRIEWAAIAKYAMIAIAIICCMILALSGLNKWGENQKYQAERAASEAQAMQSLNEATDTIKATVNTQQLEITYLLEKAYNTTNIQGILKNA